MKKIFKAILLPILSFAVISPVYSADSIHIYHDTSVH